MKFTKKILMAALAISLTSTAGLSKDYSSLKMTNSISYARENVTDKEVEKSLLDYIKTKLKDLQNDPLFDKLKYKDSYIAVLNQLNKELNVDENLTDQEKAKANDLKVEKDLINLVFSKDETDQLTIFDKLSEEEIILISDQKENGELKTEDEKKNDKALSDKIAEILKARDYLTFDSSKEDGEKVGLKEDAYKLFNQKEDSEKQKLIKEFYASIDKFKDIEKNQNYKDLKKEDLDFLKAEVQKAIAVINKADASVEEISKAKVAFEANTAYIAKILEKDPLAIKKEDLNNKLNDLENKLNKNKDKLSKEDFDKFTKFISDNRAKVENKDISVLEKTISDVENQGKELDKLIFNNKNTAYSSYEEKIREAKSLKENEVYTRSSAEKRKAFALALEKLENYIKASKNGEVIFEKNKGDQLLGALDKAKNALDGNIYDELLKSAKDKLDKNKTKLGDKYDELLNTYKELSNKENLKTVDDINNFSNEIDKEENKARLVPNKSINKTSKVKVEPKKVSVPKANNKGAKSIVRTGIDSVKIFAIVAVIALVLLIATKFINKKDK
ncbi:MAG: hypothetical protein PUG67_08990 [Peptoniphilaceae bacterium]|nr:hypothetical protein [Peptoniphilaceae bacterium]MDY6018543.1 hypothetical protein [Anaerococcus sp.]